MSGEACQGKKRGGDEWGTHPWIWAKWSDMARRLFEERDNGVAENGLCSGEPHIRGGNAGVIESDDAMVLDGFEVSVEGFELIEIFFWGITGVQEDDVLRIESKECLCRDLCPVVVIDHDGSAVAASGEFREVSVILSDVEFLHSGVEDIYYK